MVMSICLISVVPVSPRTRNVPASPELKVIQQPSTQVTNDEKVCQKTIMHQSFALYGLGDSRGHLRAFIPCLALSPQCDLMPEKERGEEGISK